MLHYGNNIAILTSENLKKVRELSLMVVVLASMVGHWGQFPNFYLRRRE